MFCCADVWIVCQIHLITGVRNFPAAYCIYACLKQFWKQNQKQKFVSPQEQTQIKVCLQGKCTQSETVPCTEGSGTGTHSSHYRQITTVCAVLCLLRAGLIKLCNQMILTSCSEMTGQLHISAIKKLLFARQVAWGWDWIHFNRIRKSAVDYLETFEELNSQDVGSSCPWSPWAEFHWLAVAGGNKNK